MYVAKDWYLECVKISQIQDKKNKTNLLESEQKTQVIMFCREYTVCKIVWQFLKNVNIHLLYVPVITPGHLSQIDENLYNLYIFCI